MVADEGRVKIRRWDDSDDVSALTRWLHLAYRPSAERGLRYVASWQDEEITRRRLGSGEAYVAEVAGRVVATVVLVPPAASSSVPYYQRPDVAYFHQLAVHPEFQGRGLAALLMEHLERRAAELGARYLALDTAESAERLIATYQRRGHAIVDTFDWPSTNYMSVILSKELGGE